MAQSKFICHCSTKTRLLLKTSLTVDTVEKEETADEESKEGEEGE